MAQSDRRHYDLWMLCTPDIPWEADPLRENPYDRDRLFTVYRDMLDRLRKPYVIIAGDREERIATATAAIHRLFAEHPGG
jgi:nicotinamide riboside kinase